MVHFSKKSLATLVVCVVVLGGLGLATGLGWFSSDSQRASTPEQSSFLPYIPADSPLVFLMRNPPEAAQQMDMWLERVDLELLLELLTGFETYGQGESGLSALFWLARDYLDTLNQGGYRALSERYGLDPDSQAAFYVSGAFPVLRMSLRYPERFMAVLAEAAAATGVDAEQTLLAGAPLHRWSLRDSTTGPAISLGLLISDGVLTLSLLTDRDTEQAQAERFARVPVSASLAEASAFAEWQRHFRQSALLMGYVDYHRIAEALLLSEQNSSGRELQQLFPEWLEQIGAEVSPACRREYVELAAAAPRLLMGLTDYRVSGNQLDYGLRGIWMLAEGEVSTSLQRLPGFLPAYSQRLDDKLFTYALGLNVDELVPVATELWSRLVGASFECEALQALQRQVMPYNPMMLSIGTALARGVQGMGVALYSLESDPTSMLGVNGSALISLSAENPAPLATLLTSYVPGMAGTLLPADGTPVPLASPFLPEGFYAALKGQHLVIYRGEPAQRAAQALAQEPLSVQGTLAVGANLRKMAQDLLAQPALLGELGSAGCVASHAALLGFNDTAAEINYRTTFNAVGVDVQVTAAMELPEPLAPHLPGEFTLSYLDPDRCEWLENGIDTLLADGSGRFSSFDQELDCSTFETEYQWRRSGPRLIQQTSAQRERSYCEQGWLDVEPEDFTCTLFDVSAEGFYCLWQQDDEVELYRFQRR